MCVFELCLQHSIKATLLSRYPPTMQSSDSSRQHQQMSRIGKSGHRILPVVYSKTPLPELWLPAKVTRRSSDYQNPLPAQSTTNTQRQGKNVLPLGPSTFASSRHGPEPCGRLKNPAVKQALGRFLLLHHAASFVLTHMCRNRIADGGGCGPTQKLPALGRLSPLLEITIRDPFTELGVDARSVEEGPQDLGGTWKGKGKGKAKEREESGVRKQSRY